MKYITMQRIKVMVYNDNTRPNKAPLVYIFQQNRVISRHSAQLLNTVGFDTLQIYNLDELINQIPLEAPACILSEYILPGTTGLMLLKRLRELNTYTPVILSSTQNEPDLLIEAFNLGCFGFLKRPFKHVELIEIVEKAISRDKKQSKYYQGVNRFNSNYKTLTRQEQRICKLLTDNLTANKIASNLSISFRTVENHRASIYQKLEVRNGQEFTRLMTMVEMFDVLAS